MSPSLHGCNVNNIGNIFNFQRRNYCSSECGIMIASTTVDFSNVANVKTCQRKLPSTLKGLQEPDKIIVKFRLNNEIKEYNKMRENIVCWRMHNNYNSCNSDLKEASRSTRAFLSHIVSQVIMQHW